MLTLIHRAIPVLFKINKETENWKSLVQWELMDFLLFHAGIVTLSCLLSADGDLMLCMSQQLKIELINSTTLHGTHVVCTHVVCNWFSTNWFRYDCAYVFDLKHRLIYVVEKNLVYVDSSVHCFASNRPC